jgi:WD40 repeat protein
MTTGTRILVLSTLFILATSLVGNAAAMSIGIDWKQSPYLPESVFSGVMITPDASMAFAGGSQILVRNWNGSIRWGGPPGFITSMSPDGDWIVTSNGITATLYNRSGQEMWSRSMGGAVRAVAVAPKAAFVVTTDDMGNWITWNRNGELLHRNKTEVARRLAIAPAGNLIVATTENGLRYYSSTLTPLWTDPREGSLDEYILISTDGSTILTYGGRRLSSHTTDGTRNWQVDVSTAAINDVACSQDGSFIVVGSQDNAVRGLDRYGKIHWTFKTVQWPNAVGTSANGVVVAAGVNDGSVIILDHHGKEQTKKQFDLRIQPRTLAMSQDGTKVVVADQRYLYGLSLHDDSVSETPDETVFVAAPLNPVPRTSEPTSVPTTVIPEVTMPEEARPTPATTKASPSGAWALLPAAAGALWLAVRGRS